MQPSTPCLGAHERLAVLSFQLAALDRRRMVDGCIGWSSGQEEVVMNLVHTRTRTRARAYTCMNICEVNLGLGRDHVVLAITGCGRCVVLQRHSLLP